MAITHSGKFLKSKVQTLTVVANGGATQSISGSAVVTLFTVFNTYTYRQANVYDTASGKFTAPVSGTYQLSANLHFAAGVNLSTFMGGFYRKNGALDTQIVASFVDIAMDTSSSDFWSVTLGPSELHLNAGDFIELVVGSSQALSLYGFVVGGTLPGANTNVRASNSTITLLHED